MDGDDIRERAVRAVRTTFPNESGLVRTESIFAIPVRNLKLDFADGSTPTGVTLVTRDLNFGTPTRSFVVTYEVANENAADELIAMLPNVRLSYGFSISAKKARQNYIQVKMADLRNSTLFAKLSGVGRTTVYVHRDDLRKLTENLHTEIQGVGVIEAPEHFNNSVFNDLAGKFQDSLTTTAAGWNEQKWQSTYQADDLKPDKITKELNKMFKKEQNEEEWHVDVEYDSSGSGSFLGVVSGEAKAKGKFKKDELRKFLREHSVHAEFEGEKWVAKSIELQQVNMADFQNTAKVVNAVTFISGDVSDVTKGHLYFAQNLAEQATHRDLGARVANVEQALHRLVPVGTVMDWYRPDPNTPVPEGFVVCDGSTVQDPGSTFNGKPVPNLIDKFVMGVPLSRQGESGGKNKLNLAHKHGFSFDLSAGRGFGWDRLLGGNGAIKIPHNFDLTGNTGEALGEIDNRPEFIGLVKIIRVK